MGETVPSGVAGVVEETVLLRRPTDAGPLRLPGTLARPDAMPDTPALGVVTLHGWGGVRCGPHRIFVRLGRKLAQAGIPTLRFDFSGRGESDGDAFATSLDGMIADALAARKYMTETLGCRSVAYCGICSGGNVAIGAASLEPVSRLALISTLPFSRRSPAMALRKTADILLHYTRKAFRLSTWKRLLRGEIDAGGVAKTVRSGGHESADERTLKDSARDIPAAFAARPAPCLFVYGGGDPEAPPARSHYEAYCRLHRIPADFRVVDKANHNFYRADWSEEVEDAFFAFLGGDSSSHDA